MKRAIAVSFLLFLLCLPAVSGELKGVKMNDTLTIDSHELVLNGMALRKKIIFKVYVAGLYLPQKEKNAGRIFRADAPRHVIMHFLRGVGAGKINDAWMEGLEANTPDASAVLKKQFERLCVLMEDMEDGERIEFTYMPATGTRVKVRGKEKGVIEGKPFADALFACWIGPKPGPGEDFKNGLLGLE